tara:strand:+ start:135 stop:392 length:258 start_codon:yes stop_codon:yes gene_type:complete
MNDNGFKRFKDWTSETFYMREEDEKNLIKEKDSHTLGNLGKRVQQAPGRAARNVRRAKRRIINTPKRIGKKIKKLAGFKKKKGKN